MDVQLGIWIGTLAVTLSYLSVSWYRRWALQRQILDIPNERSMHTRPILRGGGLAIVCVTLVGAGVYYFCFDHEVQIWFFLAYLAGAIGIAIISWLDDLYSMPNRVRFGVHALGALFVIVGIGYWPYMKLPFLGSLFLGWIGVPLVFLWMIGLTNAYNFMDGIDGIAGGQAVTAGLGWLVIGTLTGHTLVSVFGLLLAASSLGFLGHNWFPARIIMGDVGSTFLGYTFAVLPLMIHDEPYSPLIGFLLVWPFVFDASFTFLRRLLKRENVFSAHRSHLYQRLVMTGISHKWVSLMYIAMAFVGLLCSVALVQDWPGADILTVIAIAGLALLLCVSTYNLERTNRVSMSDIQPSTKND